MLCGLMLAAAALARSNLLLLAPLAAAWLYLSLRQEPERYFVADAGLALWGIASCAITVVAILAITAAQLHLLPVAGVVLFGVPHYEQSLLGLILSLFAAYFCLVAHRSRIAFDGVIAAIASSIAIVLLPCTGLLIIAVFALYRHRWQAEPSGAEESRKGFIALLGAGSVPLVILLALASAHNWKAGDGAAPLASTVGQNLYWGNTPFAYQRTTIEGASGVAWLSANEPTAVLLQRLMTRYPSANDDEAMKKAALAEMRADPGGAALRFLGKAWRDLSVIEIGRNESFAYERAGSPIFRLPLVPFWLIFGLAISYPLLSSRYRESALLFLPWVVVFVSETMFFNAARYRSLAVPFLMPLAVGGLCAIWQEVRQRCHPVKDAILLTLIAAFGVLGETAVPGKELREEQATELFKMARLELYYVDHRLTTDLKPAHPQRMEALLNAALDLDPDHLSAHYLRSMWQIDRGDVEDARVLNTERRARCASDDWLCQEVCDRIARVASAPEVYRAQVQAKVDQIRRALAESSTVLQ